jgi:hypothetical protein
MSKRVAIVQSNYIPWKGYFDLINSVDEFILFDDMQYTRRDWRNRNKIKTAAGATWLTIPVQVKGKYFQTIKETEISEPGWNELHLKTICGQYARAAHFAYHRAWLEETYRGATAVRLSEINRHFLTRTCELLGIKTRLTTSMDYQIVDGKTERLVDLCRQAGATHYVSGPAARDYIEPSLFERAGIELSFYDYTGYPAYQQIHPPFDHFVTVLDLILNQGPDATRYMLSFAQSVPSVQ